MSDRRIVIVGAGQAGAQVAFSLRQWGCDDAIVLVGDEPCAPYERPPLSKDFLKGTTGEDGLFLRGENWYADNRVELRTGERAVALDRSRGLVRLAGGEDLPYDIAVLATGARPRPLPVPGAGLDGVLVLRSIADARAIATHTRPGVRAVVVGAGYIGLEVAASARALGAKVTVVEAMDRVMARVAGKVVSDFFEREHRAQGVELRLGARLEALEGVVAVTGVRLADGEFLEADVVVVGIGVLPCDELAREAGLVCDDGVVVDRDARSSDPQVFAAGDCARRPLVHYGRSGRLESVHNAIEQGKLAAAAIVGRERPTEDVPWFWSDQYDLKLQIAGLSEGHDRVVVRGDPAMRKFAVFYLRGGALLAVDAINSPMEFMASRQLIARGAKPDAAALGDASVSMKAIVDAHRA